MPAAAQMSRWMPGRSLHVLLKGKKTSNTTATASVSLPLLLSLPQLYPPLLTP
jgi:hypothetical protein